MSQGAAGLGSTHTAGHGSMQAAGLVALALLAATPVLWPVSQPPVVTAVAELWAIFVCGLIGLLLGAIAWRQAPVAVAGFQSQRSDEGPWPRLLLTAAVIAALGSAMLAVLQVMAPAALEGPLGSVVQATHLNGRAVGHVRQPNHLATVLVWGAIGWAVLTQASAMRPGAAWVGMGLLMWALVLTGSRTGLLALLVLVGWGLVDRRLSRSARVLLLTTPVLAAVAWLGMQLWSSATASAFGAAAHLSASAGGDISSSRFAIWRNTGSLILQNPWGGVGWGHFNIAWTLTPFADRPTALFDHAHNLPLQLMAELGVPMGLGLSGLLAWWVWWAGRRAWRDQGEVGLWRRGAFMLLLVVGLHSLLEYPLWYAYFALPSLAALIVALGWDRMTPRAGRWKALVLMATGGVLTGLSAWAYADYQTIRAIYAPGPSGGPLAQRITAGQRVTWFADQAHYAMATNVRPIPGRPWTPELEQAFSRAPHVLLDARLLMAWSQALASRGEPDDLDRARHLAARLREFKAPAASAWWRACEESPPAEPGKAAAQTTPPFACQQPEKAWAWRDFIR